MRVIWRFKFLVACGFLLAILLAVLSTAKISLDHGRPALTYRQPVGWGANETLLITQHGFPEGRTIFPQAVTQTGGTVPEYADPTRLAQLAESYAHIANSDVVRNRIPLKRGESRALVTASPLVSTIGNAAP